MKNPYQHIVSFSGGKDSTAMLLKMIEVGMQIDRIICVDTTKEFPEMYEHINKVQDYIKLLKIEIIKIDFDYWFKEHIIFRGINTGKSGYGWPSSKFRWCTGLKMEAFSCVAIGKEYTPTSRNKLYKNQDKNIITYIGYNKYEKKRTKKNKKELYPLIDFNMNGEDCINYCYSKGFHWGGLYKKFKRVSCYCCPLSRLSELKIIYREHPELWEQIKLLDSQTYRKFRNDYSFKELDTKFKHSDNRLNYCTQLIK